MIGILSSKAMDDNGVMVARIDEKPYKVLSYVLPFLEKIETGTQVEVTITKDDRISKINRVRKEQRDPETAQKMQKSGFGEPATQSKEQITQQQADYNKQGGGSCTSPTTPATTNPSNSTGLKTVEGQIVFIDVAAHKITVKDRAGESHTFVWPPQAHDTMSTLQQWWFRKLTGELQEDVGIWKLTASEFFKKPEDWPHSGGKGGSRLNWQPRNEKIIVYQTCYKECCETVRQQMMAIGQDFDEAEYNRVMDIAVARAIKDGKALIAAGGA